MGWRRTRSVGLHPTPAFAGTGSAPLSSPGSSPGQARPITGVRTCRCPAQGLLARLDDDRCEWRRRRSFPRLPAFAGTSPAGAGSAALEDVGLVEGLEGVAMRRLAVGLPRSPPARGHTSRGQALGLRGRRSLRWQSLPRRKLGTTSGLSALSRSSKKRTPGSARDASTPACAGAGSSRGGARGNLRDGRVLGSSSRSRSSWRSPLDQTTTLGRRTVRASRRVRRNLLRHPKPRVGTLVLEVHVVAEKMDVRCDCMRINNHGVGVTTAVSKVQAIF